MDYTIEHLRGLLAELELRTDFETLYAKAEHIGKLNSLSVAIKLLELCDKHGIHSGSWFCSLPEEIPGLHYPRYRVVCDNETGDEAQWTEVVFPDRGELDLDPGDVVIKR